MNDMWIVETKPAQIVLHRAQALVTRTGTLAEVPPGLVRLKFLGLPVSLMDDSVRLTVAEGTRPVVDLHVAWDLAPRVRALRPDLDQATLSVKRQLAELEVARDRSIAQLKLLAALKPRRVDVTELPEAVAFVEHTPITGLLRAMDYRDAREPALQQALQKLEAERRRLHDELARLTEAQAQQSQAASADLLTAQKVIVATLGEGALLNDATVQLSYVVPQVAWAPVYELRIESQRAQAELVVRALAAQKSGEDWPAVPLHFDTADLARSTELPRLDSWRIGKAQPQARSGWRDLSDFPRELFAGFDQGLGTLPPPPTLPRALLPELPRLGAAALVSTAATLGGLSFGAGAAPRYEPEAPSDEAPADDDILEAEDGFADREIEAPTMLAEQATSACEKQEASPPPPAPMMSRSMVAMAPAPRRSRELAKELKKRAAPKPTAGCDNGGGELAATRIVAVTQTALLYENLRLALPDDRSRRGQLHAVSGADELFEVLGQCDPGLATQLGSARAAAGLLLPPAPLSLSWPPHVVPIATSSGSFAARYLAEGVSALPADGQLHSVALTRKSGEARKTYAVVPGQDPTVFALATFINPLELPLLAGPVAIYRDGEFVVEAPLSTTAPGQALTVNLGAEPGLLVARNTFFNEASGGLLGGSVELRHKVTLEVRSKLAYPAKLTIYERLPVSDNKEIKVTLVSSQPKAVAYDQRERGALVRGGLALELEVAPMSVQEATLEYVVSLPSKQVLVGGNRRD